MYGVSFACAFYLPQWSIRLIIQVRGKAFNPETAGWFAEAIVLIVLLGAIFFFGHHRDQFLRRDHLKVKIANYGDDWLEIVGNDGSYFGELVRDSTIFSSAFRLAPIRGRVGQRLSPDVVPEKSGFQQVHRRSFR
jgi:hypothetical protein